MTPDAILLRAKRVAGLQVDRTAVHVEVVVVVRRTDGAWIAAVLGRHLVEQIVDEEGQLDLRNGVVAQAQVPGDVRRQLAGAIRRISVSAIVAA